MITLLYGIEPELLKRICTDMRVLEIGSYEGGSTCIIAEVAKSVVCIDTFNSDCILGVTNTNTLRSFKHNTRKFKNVNYIVGDSKEVEFYEDFDILFVDGDHSYDGCWNDLQRFYPKKGWLIHDYRSEIFWGVTAACMNFFGRFPDEVLGNLAYYKRIY